MITRQTKEKKVASLHVKKTGMNLKLIASLVQNNRIFVQSHYFFTQKSASVSVNNSDLGAKLIITISFQIPPKHLKRTDKTSHCDRI